MTTPLRIELADLINRSHQSTWATFDWVCSHPHLYQLSAKKVGQWVTPGEPAFVSNLLEYPANQDFLSGIVDRHLQPLGISKVRPIVSGVFIHQKPMVQFQGYRGYVELGDLLLVRHHFQSGVAAPQGRAFLLQAKSSGHPGTGHLRGKEAQQFALYADWSKPFVFPRKDFAAPPNGSGHWNFKNGPLPYSSSGVYGIVAKERMVPTSFPLQCPWAVGFATAPGTGATPSVNAGSLSLAEALEGFLLGSWGRTWNATPPTSDHWSSFILECLAAASQWRPYPIQRIGATSRERRRNVMGLAVAMAASPYLRRPDSSTLGSRIDDVLKVVFRWERSLGLEGEGHDGPPEIRFGDSSPWRGMSTLYVATFGDEPLKKIDEEFERTHRKDEPPRLLG